ncbi:MAG: 50S ribosomal protein L29 [Candidatus Doudnabacteria bacterium]|nr:50S ribosomal protein L29 [Candidatus Doudnabacteria bacterium]
MTIKELRNKGTGELNRMLASMREQARDLRFKIYSKEVKNNHQLKALRKDIARILTLLNEKQ